MGIFDDLLAVFDASHAAVPRLDYYFLLIPSE